MIKIKSEYPEEFWKSNEYLKEISGHDFEVEDFLGEKSIGDGDIAARLSWDFKSEAMSQSFTFTVRSELVRKYAWAIPTPETLAMVAKYSPLIEIGAGTGYWAYLLTKLGADIICYDNDRNFPRDVYYLVNVGGEKEASKYGDRTLFLCWPPYNEAMAANCLKAYTGNTLIYIGEGAGMCTGDDEFHEILEKEWKEIECCELLKWSGLHDHLWVYGK